VILEFMVVNPVDGPCLSPVPRVLIMLKVATSASQYKIGRWANHLIGDSRVSRAGGGDSSLSDDGGGHATGDRAGKGDEGGGELDHCELKVVDAEDEGELE
jgi:hypothetical protein